MPLDPLLLLGAVVAAGIVLALARSEAQRFAWRYSLRSLLIVTTIVAITFGFVSVAVRLEMLSLGDLADIGTFAALNAIAALTVLFARWVNGKRQLPHHCRCEGGKAGDR
jgi:hypothetical protein